MSEESAMIQLIQKIGELRDEFVKFMLNEAKSYAEFEERIFKLEQENKALRQRIDALEEQGKILRMRTDASSKY